MELRVLGCAGGWPAAGRACSGYLAGDGRTRVWLDAGAGTLAELVRHTALAGVDALWISHLHPDHCADLGGAGLFLCEAFRSLPRPAASDTVMPPEQAGSVATAAGPGRLLLTHLHPDAGPAAAAARARTTWAGPVDVARQGEVYRW